jgi:hypothetical protein
VDVGVDEAREQQAAGQVDLGGPRPGIGNVELRLVDDGRDPVTVDHDGHAAAMPGAVEHRSVAEDHPCHASPPMPRIP